MAEKRVQSFRDLDAWQLGMNLAVVIYGVVKHLPPSEQFGLSSQIRRAAVSVPCNVAEGQACGEDGRYIHHLRVAIGSLGELSTQVEIAARLAHVAARARVGNRGIRWQNRPGAPRVAQIQVAEAASAVSGIRASLLRPLV